MKQLLTKTLTTIFLALAIAPSLQAKPVSFAKLDADDITIALIGDLHYKSAHDDAYLKALHGWIAQLKSSKKSTYFLLEFVSNKQDQQDAVNADTPFYAAEPQLLNRFCFDAFKNNFKYGSATIIPEDPRCCSIRAFINFIMWPIMIKTLVPEIEGMHQYSVKDLDQQLQKLSDKVDLQTKAFKRTYHANIKACGIIDKLTQKFNTEVQTIKKFFTEEMHPTRLIDLVNSLAQQSDGPAVVEKLASSFAGVALSRLADLHLIYAILEAAQKNQQIVAYVGEVHVYHIVAVLQELGFKVADTSILHSKPGTLFLNSFIPPNKVTAISPADFAQALNSTFVETKEEVKAEAKAQEPKKAVKKLKVTSKAPQQSLASLVQTARAARKPTKTLDVEVAEIFQTITKVLNKA